METTQTFLDELRAVLREQAHRDPLFDAVREGRMGRAAMKRWALQVMLVVRQFPRFVSAIHANCPHRDAQRLLAENLWEEHGEGDAALDHLSLAERLARALGATEAEVREAEPLPETRDYIEHCLRTTRERPFVAGMAAIGVGIERFMPVFFGFLADSLRRTHGLTDEEVEYLTVHIGADEDHARRSMEMIEKYADTDDVREQARQALRETLAVKRRFSDAVYAHCVGGSD